MKVGFKVKYGYNEIDIPITEETKPKYRPYGMTDKFVNKVTIYNDIPYDGVNLRRFDRFVIDKCNIQGGYTERANGTIQSNLNSKVVITKDVEHYKKPYEYMELAEDERDNFYTVQIDDFVVLGEVDDIVTTSKEWQALQQKYGNGQRGWLVTAEQAYEKSGSVSHIEITHA